jgi:hypothetical protein
MFRGSWLALGGLILSGTIFVGLSVWMFGPDELVYWSKFRDSEALMRKVEAFRAKEGRLPKKEEAGNDRILYEPCPDGSYIIWFGTTLGESMTYESRNGRWVDVGGGCLDFDLEAK